MPQTESLWENLSPVGTNTEYTYLRNGLSYLNSNWSTVYSKLAADGLASGLSKPINASTGHNSLILIGIAIQLCYGCICAYVHC